MIDCVSGCASRAFVPASHGRKLHEKIRELQAKLAKAHDQEDYDDLDRQLHSVLRENEKLKRKASVFAEKYGLLLLSIQPRKTRPLDTIETQDDIVRRRVEILKPPKGRSRPRLIRDTTRGRSR